MKNKQFYEILESLPQFINCSNAYGFSACYLTNMFTHQIIGIPGDFTQKMENHKLQFNVDENKASHMLLPAPSFEGVRKPLILEAAQMSQLCEVMIAQAATSHLLSDAVHHSLLHKVAQAKKEQKELEKDPTFESRLEKLMKQPPVLSHRK